VADGYGDRRLDVRVASDLGRHLIERLIDEDFDVSQASYLRDAYGGRVARRYPTRDGELDAWRDTPPRAQGLPHGFGFVVKRLFHNEPGVILPVLQNTCYPPNTPTSRRCYAFGQAIARAVEDWEVDARVAIIASGGLSHFVVDEEFDRRLLQALAAKDAATLTSPPRHRHFSATSESLNWVTVSGALERTALRFELVDYVAVYRSEAGTGGGWAFGRWV
jgi:3-O-methylgallate 3,4-dioxygenase